MDKTTTILSIGVIFGATIFLGFFGLIHLGYEVFGIPFLSNFIAMIGLILFFISGFFLFALKTPKY